MKKYRLTIHPAMEKTMETISFYFDTKEELLAASDTTANTILFIQDECKAMEDYTNCFSLEELVDGEYEHIEG